MKKVYKENQLAELNNLTIEVFECKEGVNWTSFLFLL